MKGIIFQLLEEVVSHEYGDDMWERLLQGAGLDGAYTSLGTYPDSEIEKLVGEAAAATGLPSDEVLRWFGRAALPALATRYPEFFTSHTSTRSFLLTLNSIIHTEVRKLYPGAEVPEFDFDEQDDGRLTMRYHSPRSLCPLAEGLIHGAADHFGEQVTIDQPECKLRGDPTCLLVCSFGGGVWGAQQPGGAPRARSVQSRAGGKLRAPQSEGP